MSSPSSRSVTQLLTDLRRGDPSAFDALFPHVYDELRRVARGHLARERPNHTMSATALVHEAYIKMMGQEGASFQDRVHFLSVAALAMRRILTSYARARKADKRGGGVAAVSLHDSALGDGLDVEELLAVDECLSRLEAVHERQAKVVAYRLYGGLTDAEIASALDVSLPTVRRDWRVARAWMMRELGRPR